MNASSYVSEYIKSEVVKVTGPMVCIVASVEEVRFEDKDTHVVEKKLAVTLIDEQKVLLNKSNCQTLIELFKSANTDTWTGRRFELYHDPNVTFGGKRVGGLRVRAADEDSDPF